MNRARGGQSRYESAGIDEAQAKTALRRVTERVAKTWPAHSAGTGAVKLPIGYFANVVEVAGTGIALCTDGVGSKTLIAQMTGKYDTIGIDCVAMNVNDLICVGARPVSMVDYIAVENPEPHLLDEIAQGLCTGADQAAISITGGEIAQLPEVIRGHREGAGFDLVGMAIGVVDLDRIVTGADIDDGDVVVGVESSGIHSNGLTLARDVFFKRHGFAIDQALPGLDAPLGAELLKPTNIYVKEALDLLAQGFAVKALVHITSDGFFNLTRVDSQVGYVIDNLPPPPPIFSLIRDHGDIGWGEMFIVYNMGIGFCFVVPPQEARDVVSLLESHGRRAWEIGRATTADPGSVSIPAYRLSGTKKNKKFSEA